MKRMPLLTLSLLVPALGCSDADIKLVVAALGFVAPPNTCFKDGTPPNETESAGFLTGGDWTMFRGDGKQWFLDVQDKIDFKMGEAPDVSLHGVLAGERNDDEPDKFTFSGRSIATTAKPADAFKTIETREISVALELMDELVKGSVTVVSNQACEGTCANDFSTKNPSCTITYPLTGTRHEIDTAVLAVGTRD